MKKTAYYFAILVVICAFVSSNPNQAYAGLASGSVVIVGADIPQNLKQFSWDTIGWAAANTIVSSITKSIVNWANSGFQGKPAFSQNFNKELKNAENDAFTSVLTDININNINAAGFLCGPFSQELHDAFRVQLAVAKGADFKHSNCTIEGVLAEGGRTVTDFENDFSSGGWPAWLELTTNPVNNRYGAFFTIQKEIWDRQNQTAADRSQQLTYGSGFLSQKKFGDCLVTLDQAEANLNTSPLSNEQVDAQKADLEYQALQDPGGENCLQRAPDSIVTPGQTINTALNKALGLSSDRIAMADQINEVIGSLASAFISKAFSSAAGLFGASDSSKGPSLTDQLGEEAQQGLSDAKSAAAGAEKNAQTTLEKAQDIEAKKKEIDDKQAELDQCNADVAAMTIKQIVVETPGGGFTIQDDPKDIAAKKKKQAECDQIAEDLQSLKDELQAMEDALATLVENTTGTTGANCSVPDGPAAPGKATTLTPGNFTATEANPLMHVLLPSSGSYSKVIVDLDVKVGPFNSSCPSTFGGGCYHAVFWLQRGKKWCSDNIGYINIVGPNKHKLKLETSSNGDQGADTGATYNSGQTYHVHYEVGAGAASGTVGGAHVGYGYSDFINFKNGAFIDFGQTTGDGPEVESIGWSYNNIKIELVPTSDTGTSGDTGGGSGGAGGGAGGPGGGGGAGGGADSPAGQPISIGNGTFTPTKSTPLLHLDIPALANTSYSKASVDMDVTIGPFDSSCDKSYNNACYNGLFHLLLGTKQGSDDIGWGNVVGPTNKGLRLSSTLGGNQNAKTKKTFVQGGTYHVHYEVGGGQASLAMGDDTGTTTASYTTSFGRLNFKSGSSIEVGQKNDGGGAVPTYGWRYDNINLVLTP